MRKRDKNKLMKQAFIKALNMKKQVLAKKYTELQPKMKHKKLKWHKKLQRELGWKID